MKCTSYIVHRTSLWRILFASILLASCANAIENPEEGDLVFGKKAFSDGFHDLARERFENFIKDYPRTSHADEVHVLLGRCYYYQNNLKKALYELEIILNNPKAMSAFHDEATYWAGEVHFKNGDYKRAMEYYEKIIDNFPSSRYLSYAVYSKAWSYYKLGFLEEAIRTFREVVSKYPFEKSAMESQFRIGECEYLLGRYDGASRELGIFTEKFPVSEKTAEAYYLSGEAAFYRAKYKDAIAHFSRAVSISPNVKWAAFAVYRMARCHYLLGDNASAVKEFKRCLAALNDDYLTAKALLGLAESY